MEYRILGKTGLKISRLGFGGIPIQRIEGKDVKPLMRLLIEKGINYIDTARGYTVSESYLGQALEGIRDHFILATKSMSRDREAMARDIEISLGNLRTNYIDLYQVHNPSLEQLEKVIGPGGALEALMEAKHQGKIGHIGLTAHSREVFEKALELPWVETIMFPYNLVETQGEELIHRCTEKNIGFVCMKPLAGGALEDVSLSLRFIFSNPDVTVVIPGMGNEQEIEQNYDAFSQSSVLSDEDYKKIDSIRKTLGTTFCRRCNYCAPCTVGLDIPGIFVLNGYLTRYGLASWAQSRYQSMPHHAHECVECGACESRCPYELPIIKMMKEVKDNFGE